MARAAPKRDDNKPKIPKTLGECADKLYTTRNQRLSDQKDVASLEEFEKLLKDHIIAELPKSKADGITGKLATATISTDDVPIVEDWVKFGDYLKKTKFFHLLQRRLNAEAVREILESGKKIPGVGIFKNVKVNVRKR